MTGLYSAPPPANIVARMVSVDSMVDRMAPGDVLHVHPSRMGDVAARPDVTVEFDLVRELHRVRRRLARAVAA